MSLASCIHLQTARLLPRALVMSTLRRAVTRTYWREALTMGCQTTVQRGWVRERNDCWCGLLKNNRRLPLRSVALERVAVVEQVAVLSQHWMGV